MKFDWLSTAGLPAIRLCALRLCALRPRAALMQGMVAVALGLAAGHAGAHDPAAGDVHIEQAFATPTPPGSKIGAAYLSATNQGKQEDRLVRATSPVAARVELHTGEIGTDGVMRMRELDGIPVPAGSTTGMKPGGGQHLMLMELAKPLVQGESFPMTLEFERGGKVEIQVKVQAAMPGAARQHGHGN